MPITPGTRTRRLRDVHYVRGAIAPQRGGAATLMELDDCDDDVGSDVRTRKIEDAVRKSMHERAADWRLDEREQERRLVNQREGLFEFVKRPSKGAWAL